MAKKPTNCKVTQLDRIEKMLRSIESRLANLNAFETLQEALSEHGKKQPENVALKAGDWVVVEAPYEASEVKPGSVLRIHDIDASGDVWVYPSTGPYAKYGCCFNVKRRRIRHATQEEIDTANPS